MWTRAFTLLRPIRVSSVLKSTRRMHTQSLRMHVSTLTKANAVQTTPLWNMAITSSLKYVLAEGELAALPDHEDMLHSQSSSNTIGRLTIVS
mmetsp:Transcript_7219/g.13276  ORF Transcript_7219/g.13276 Transcript_7219/m.13276 type:complete len:92 (+) Transcript_7219:835-1110(+)